MELDEIQNPENELSLTTVGSNTVGHLPHEKFMAIISNPDSPFSVILETGGSRFQLLGYDPGYNAFILARV